MKARHSPSSTRTHRIHPTVIQTYSAQSSQTGAYSVLHGSDSAIVNNNNDNDQYSDKITNKTKDVKITNLQNTREKFMKIGKIFKIGK